MNMIRKKLPPVHPGEVLREEFRVPMRMSAGKLADICGVPRTRIKRVASEQTGIAADAAIRLDGRSAPARTCGLTSRTSSTSGRPQNASAKEFARIGRVNAAWVDPLPLCVVDVSSGRRETAPLD